MPSDRFDPFGGLFDLMFEGAYVVDDSRAIRTWNRAAEQITGYAAAEVVGKRCFDNLLVHVDFGGKALCQQGCPLHLSIEDGATREVDMFVRHKDGHRIPVGVRIHPLKDSDGRVYGAVELFRDVSPRVADLQRIRELEGMAYVDALTGLANRRFLEVQLQVKLDEMKRYGWPFGVLFTDIDLFKDVNDRYGHAIGDRTLKVVAETMLRSARSFDMIGRWGGEEFAVIVSNVTPETLRNIGHRYRALVASAGFFVDFDEIKVTISVGATLARSDDTLESLMKRADRLLYQSKAEGRNTVSLE